MPEGLERIKHYCAYQDRCHSEVRNKLLELSYRGDELEEVISMLISEDFLNEERFARSYCRGKFRFKNWGRVKIIQQLKARQVSDYCIKKGLEEIDEREYLHVLEQLFLKKLETLRNEKNSWRKKSKLLQYLRSKGFEPSLIYLQLDKL